jgi:hypothetical protein
MMVTSTVFVGEPDMLMLLDTKDKCFVYVVSALKRMIEAI